MPAVTVNGIRLNVERSGDGSALLLLHGFTGSVATWTPHLAGLAQRFATVAVDLIGHGASDAPADHARYRMERCVEDLIALLDQLGIERTAVLGYSMGGRVALHLAVMAPDRVAALVLESTSPGIADPEERAARLRSDSQLAELIEREGIRAFVDRWEGLPLFASQATLPVEVREQLRAQRLANDPGGLANSLRGMGAGAMPPVVDRLGEIRVPVLFIAGELDTKYCEIGRAMVARMPAVRLAIVEGAGHAVHLERPEEFQRLVGAFLAEEYDHCLARGRGACP